MPPLLQESLVQASFLSYVAAWGLDGAFGRSAHIAYPQVLHRYDRVVFADFAGNGAGSRYGRRRCGYAAGSPGAQRIGLVNQISRPPSVLSQQ